MTRLFAIVLLAAVLLCRAAPLKAADTGTWHLYWSDEFDGPAGAAPSPKRWTYDTGGDGWGNRELENYCAAGSSKAPCDPAAPNAFLDGRGRLVISAVQTSSGAWTSARLKTQGLKAFKYGRVEARLRLPTGAGLWPAFWLLGVDISSVGWPACGEIDILENVPADVPRGLGPDTIKSTIHGPGYFGDNGVGQTAKLPRRGRVDDGFHAYGAIWSPGKIEFYVDDWKKPFMSATRASLPSGAPWVFDKPFFIIMNLAVGGSWPGAPSGATPNPAQMRVDYVRVYHRGS